MVMRRGEKLQFWIERALCTIYPQVISRSAFTSWGQLSATRRENVILFMHINSTYLFLFCPFLDCDLFIALQRIKFSLLVFTSFDITQLRIIAVSDPKDRQALRPGQKRKQKF